MDRGPDLGPLEALVDHGLVLQARVHDSSEKVLDLSQKVLELSEKLAEAKTVEKAHKDAHKAHMDEVTRYNTDLGRSPAELDVLVLARMRSNARFGSPLEALGAPGVGPERGNSNPPRSQQGTEADVLAASAAAIARQLRAKADAIGVLTSPSLADTSVIFPRYAHNGELLDGPAKIAGELRLLSSKLEQSAVEGIARRCAPFPQALTPQFLVQRILHLWSEPPPHSSAGHEVIPEDNSGQSVLLHRRLSGGTHAKAWDIILEIFLLTMLARNYTRRWGEMVPDMGGQGIAGNPIYLAKRTVRHSIAREMLGPEAHQSMVDERAKSLVTQVKRGEDLNDYLGEFETTSLLGLIVVIPWEKITQRNPGKTSIAGVPRRCLQWMIGRMTRGDDLGFIRELANLAQQYVRPAMVLDRLTRRPVTPNDMGSVFMAGDVAEFKRVLNLVLVGSSLHPLDKWTLLQDPIDAMRCVRDRESANIHWNCTAEGAIPGYSSVFSVPDARIDEIADVDQDTTAGRVVLALKAMTGLGCPYGIVSKSTMRGEGALLARFCKQWVVVLKAPAAGGKPAHMYCAVVFLDHDISMARVGIISSLAGEADNISTHCRDVVGRWLGESDSGFLGNSEYFYYPVKKCASKGGGLYSIGATMIHAMAIIKIGRVYYGDPVNRTTSRQIRESAKHALVVHRPTPAFMMEDEEAEVGAQEEARQEIKEEHQDYDGPDDGEENGRLGDGYDDLMDVDDDVYIKQEPDA